MTDANRPHWPTTPMTDADPDATDPASTEHRDSPDARPHDKDPQHGPGGMDAIDEEPIRAPDDDAPGGMTGIPEGDEA